MSSFVGPVASGAVDAGRFAVVRSAFGTDGESGQVETVVHASACRMFDRCRATVLALIIRVSAIAREECPSAVSFTISSGGDDLTDVVTGCGPRLLAQVSTAHWVRWQRRSAWPATCC